MNHVRVLFFATVRDKAGTKGVELDVEAGTTVQQLKKILAGRYPAITDVLEHCLAAVNHEYSAEDGEVPADAEVAFFPPVSGGGEQLTVGG